MLDAIVAGAALCAGMAVTGLLAAACFAWVGWRETRGLDEYGERRAEPRE